MTMNDFIKAVYRKDLSKMMDMLSDGFDINTKDADGRTALMHAVLDSEPDIETIKFIFKNSCDINSRDRSQKWSALHFGARDNKKEVVTTLLKYEPLVDATDAFGNTPLLRAVMEFKGNVTIVAHLLKSGAEVPPIKRTV